MRLTVAEGMSRCLASATGKPVLMRGAALDITSRKQAEEAARDLSGRLIQAQEEQQMQLARDLHDDLSQSLALLSIELEMFGRSQPADGGHISARMQEFSGCRRKPPSLFELRRVRNADKVAP